MWAARQRMALQRVFREEYRQGVPRAQGLMMTCSRLKTNQTKPIPLYVNRPRTKTYVVLESYHTLKTG